jgi:Schlafen, AlbA_2
MHPPLEEWDAAYLATIATPDESADLEKKASAKFDPAGAKSATREELAKQVCAFANSGGGFLVYGIEESGAIDAGVTAVIGAQPIKAWVEAEIPRLLQPQVLTCQAKLIQVTGHHATDRGVLVIEIPTSQHRPHWTKEQNKEVPYIRSGEHSAPMQLRTFLDIASRTDAAEAVIDSLGILQGSEEGNGQWKFVINPVVRLVAGPVCMNWGFQLNIPTRSGQVVSPHVSQETNVSYAEPGLISFLGHEPLIPGRPTKVVFD